MTATIPVYRSRFTPSLQRGDGAFIAWEIGERVRILSQRGSLDRFGTVLSDVMVHDAAPEIDGAHGRGRWVREVRWDDEGIAYATSTAHLWFADEAQRERVA